MEFLEDLTDVQREAVTHVDGPMLVLAGPGSGKTRVVTSRVAHLLHKKIPPHNILALTFTNKAAEEMRQRIARLAPGNPVWVSTFHRFCSQLLRQYGNLVGLMENFRIYDAKDSLAVLKTVINDNQVPLRRSTPAQIARVISNAKNQLISPEQYGMAASGPLEAIAAEIYPDYQKRLLASNAVDFDDLLMHIALLLRDNAELRSSLDERYQYILVDEYQDTNLAQYTIVRGLSIDHPNLSVTGDPDQSIYAWRGADIKNILEFERDFPEVKVVRLEQNYRSTKHILNVADQLITNNQYRKQKSLFTDNDKGEPVRLVRYEDGREEADDIARQIGDCIREGTHRPKHFAILYRTNALSRNLEHALHDYGVPYQIVNGVEFYQRKEIKDVMAYLHLINNDRDEVAFLRVVNTPPRGIGAKSLGRLREHANAHHLTLLESAAEATNIEGLTKRAANSLHKFAKIFEGLSQVAGDPVEGVVGRVLMDTGYKDHLADSQSEEDQQRLANIEELLTAAKQFDDRYEDGGTLEEFLEQAALVNDTDAWDAETDCVTLMTLHAAKGLEFPAVYIMAVEQGILPHERSRDDPFQMEEERRLLFVGITRAERNLQLSLTEHREYRGRHRRSVPSLFVMELPRADMECYGTDPATYLARHEGQQDEAVDDYAQAFDDLADEWAQHADQSNVEQSFSEAADADADAGFDPFEGDIDQSDPSEPRKSDSENRKVAKMTTAAEMLRADDSHDGIDPPAPEPFEPIPPEDYSLGMLVKHPQYGPGKVMALSGKENKRTATIQFLNPPEQRKFRLAFCELQPV